MSKEWNFPMQRFEKQLNNITEKKKKKFRRKERIRGINMLFFLILFSTGMKSDHTIYN